MEKFKLRINSWLNTVSKFIIKGLLIVIPFWITWYVVQRIANWVISKSEIFLFYLPKDEASKHKIWFAVAVVTSLFILWVIGYVSEKTIFGKKLDKGLDKTFSSIKGVGGIYSFANKLTEIFGENQQNTGKPVLVPFLNSMMQQLGYITNKDLVTFYNPALQREVNHYVVNFAPAFALMGGSVVFIPEEMVDEYNEKMIVKFTTDEAFKFNLSGGSILPDKFIIKKEEKTQ